MMRLRIKREKRLRGKRRGRPPFIEVVASAFVSNVVGGLLGGGGGGGGSGGASDLYLSGLQDGEIPFTKTDPSPFTINVTQEEELTPAALAYNDLVSAYPNLFGSTGSPQGSTGSPQSWTPAGQYPGGPSFDVDPSKVMIPTF